MAKSARRNRETRHWLRTLAVTFTVSAALTTAAAAQTPPQPPGAAPFETSVGYQFLTVTDDPGTTFPFGLAVDIALNAGAFGFVAEGGWSKRSEGDEPDDVSFNFWHAGAGIRWSSRSRSRFRPYAQTLLGVAIHQVTGEIGGSDQTDTTSHFMVQPGGGVHVVIGNGLGIFGAVDYRRVLLDEATEGASGLNEIRLFVGFRLSLR